MGVIQGSINNLLTMAGAAAYLSPQLKKAKEISALKKDIAATEKLDEEAQGTKEYEEIVEPINKRLAESYSELARLDPTEKNIRAYSAHEGAKKLLTDEYQQEEKALIAAKKDLEKKQREAKLGKDFRSNTPEFAQMFTEGGRFK